MYEIKRVYDSRVKAFVPVATASTGKRVRKGVPYNFLTDPEFKGQNGMVPRSQIDLTVSGLGAYRTIKGKVIPSQALTCDVTKSTVAKVKAGPATSL